MYYTFNPIWKDNTRPNKMSTFVGDNRICSTKFRSLEDGFEAARLDGTCFRESNWEVFEHSLFCKKRIMLKTLQKLGFFSPVVKKDIFGEYYTPK